MATEVAAARRRIIRRPRLTSILDDSAARIRLLTAPAGYGKTTLAREWLGEPDRRGVWYRGGPASADVAALAAGIAEAASELITDAGKRMRDRLRATGHPEEDVEILAELFAEDVQQWPEDAWLAFDDYQFAMESAASERFVDLLTEQTPIQMLITSRRRPTWATARRILYGEILEIDRRALAMEEVEAREVLGRADPSSEALIARARGWPAVLGLAALTREVVLPPEDLPDTLHTFFAEELFQSLDPSLRRDLSLLALARTVSEELVSFVFDPGRAQEVIATGHRVGVFTAEGDSNLSIHPLLQDFLRRELSYDADAIEAAERLSEYYLGLDQWDDAYELAQRSSLPSLQQDIIAAGLDPMLSEGRLATVERWVEAALAAHLNAPILDLAESELAFRRGEHQRAYVLAEQAARRLQEPDLCACAHVRAGHSALLASNETAGLDHFRSARQLATTRDRRREALVGLYFAASELDAPDAAMVLEELETSEEHTPDGILRIEVLRLTRATRGGGVTQALQAALPKVHLADRATDPLGLTAFLHMLATCLNLAARYEESLNIAERQLAVASDHRLDLPVVHAQLNLAISHVGLKNFQRSTEALDDVRQRLPSSGDQYLEAAVQVIECRSLIARQRFRDALALTADHGETISSPPVRAEYLSCRALALACVGESGGAEALIHEADQVFPASLELRVISKAVKAVTSIQADDGSHDAHAKAAWRAAQTTGNFDSLVCSYRAQSEILRAVLDDAPCRRVATQLLVRTRDHDLAHKVGITELGPAEQRGSLTTRERDVLGELEQGFSNREIAGHLFISEATVKVHLRHIYEKMGVRTRTELLAKRATRR